MGSLKKDNGVTLIALIITIIIILILASITIYSGANSIKVAKSNSLQAQLSVVQHAALERYTQYTTSNDVDIIAGTKISNEEAEKVASELGVTLKEEGEYYRLTPSDLSRIGITEGLEDTYIVNYQTGEVMNETETKTPLGEALYTSAE